jgi:hypothetical protein
VPQDRGGLSHALSRVHRAYTGVVQPRQKRAGHFWQEINALSPFVTVLFQPVVLPTDVVVDTALLSGSMRPSRLGWNGSLW